MEKEKILAVFYPLSKDAALLSAHKITHYGQYGLLAFRSGKNSIKGINRVNSMVAVTIAPEAKTR
jgi:hypothetical protein